MRLIVLLFCLESVARADSFNQGLTAYRHSNFSAAERAFLKLLQEGVNRATRAKVYKYIGLSQYMLGRKADAGNSFRSALRFDPMIELYPKEVLDSSVIEFFLQIKQESRKKPTTAQPVRRPPLRKPLAKKPYVPRVPMASSQRVVRGKPAKKPTTNRTINKKPPPKARPKEGSLFGTKKPKKISFGKKTRQPTVRDSRPQNGLLLPSNKKLSLRSDDEVSAWHFLPFGAGQFVNDSWLKLPMLVGQVVSLGGASWMYIIALDRENERDSNDDYKELKKNPDHDPEDYIERYDAWVNEPKIWFYVGLGSFISLWIGGTVEAVINRPASASYSMFIPELHYHNSNLAFAWQIIW